MRDFCFILICIAAGAAELGYAAQRFSGFYAVFGLVTLIVALASAIQLFRQQHRVFEIERQQMDRAARTDRSDLDFITTQELAAEIIRRNDASIVCWGKIEVNDVYWILKPSASWRVPSEQVAAMMLGDLERRICGTVA